MKEYDKDKESLYLKYWDVNNLYGWKISQELPVYDIKLVEEISQFNEDLIKSYNEESNVGYFLEVDVQYHEKLHVFHSEISFLPKRMKIKKVVKRVVNLHDKKEYVMHIRNLKQALKHGLDVRKSHRVIKFD